MTTSFTRTRNQLKTIVLDKLGVTSTTSADADKVYEAIDLRLKEMHRLGIFWRKVSPVPLSFALTANVNSASASADIIFPIKMTVSDLSKDRDVRIIDIREYAAIEDKALTGVPTKALWKGGAEWLFWPVTTVARTAKLVYEKIADDTADATAPDVDVAMLRWLKDICAYDLCDTFKQPEAKIIRLEREAMRAELNIRKLAVQHVDYAPVAVDDFDSRPVGARSDYGWVR